MVEKRLPRLHRRQEGRQARHSRLQHNCELILDDCRVPKENVLGEVGKGYKIAIETLNEGRIGIGAQMLGLARGAWEFAVEYAQERKQFGQPIAEFQGFSSRSRRWRPRSKPRACCSTTARA
jgi:alkylation response protein AidB-like acyl-CoA dehydrogenase